MKDYCILTEIHYITLHTTQNVSSFEVDFWTVASAFLEPSANVNLDTRYDLTADCASYLRYQLERLHLHESKISNAELRRRVIDQMLCLGLKDEAVALLLESEPDTNPHHYEDNLRACLVSACDGHSNQSNTTMKLVRLPNHNSNKLVAFIQQCIDIKYSYVHSKPPI